VFGATHRHLTTFRSGLGVRSIRSQRSNRYRLAVKIRQSTVAQRRPESTLSGHTGPPTRPRAMEEQSGREFASADPTARAPDATLQERRFCAKIPLHPHAAYNIFNVQRHLTSAQPRPDNQALDSRQHKNYRLARCAKASAARQSISNISCAPASAVMPPVSKGGETSTTSAPTMSVPRNPCSSRLAS
jgi:hypothetical protein